MVEGIIGSIVATIIVGVAIFGYRIALSHSPWLRSLSVHVPQLLTQKPVRIRLSEIAPRQIRENARLLVIDDEDYAHYDVLRRRGFEVTRWSSISTADAQDLDRKYELILLDVRGVVDDTGSSSGLDAIRLLRRDNPWIPIVIYTSHIRTVRGKNAETAKALSDGVLKKTLPFDDFLESVFDTMCSSFRSAHFVSRLEGVGVENAEQVVGQVEVKGPAHVEGFTIAEGGGAATRRIQSEKILEVLDEVCSGRRWQSPTT